MKNNILSLPDRRIMFLSQTYAGSVHDKRICDLQPLHLPGGINLWQDTGFIGHCPDGINIQMPTKKPKGKELTEELKTGKPRNIQVQGHCRACHLWGQALSYCQRPFAMPQVWVPRPDHGTCLWVAQF